MKEREPVDPIVKMIIKRPIPADEDIGGNRCIIKLAERPIDDISSFGFLSVMETLYEGTLSEKKALAFSMYYQYLFNSLVFHLVIS